MEVSSETRRQGFRYYAKYYQTHTQTAKASGLAAKLIGLGTVARSKARGHRKIAEHKKWWWYSSQFAIGFESSLR